MQRRFSIIGHRAPSTGRLQLNDLSGSSGRMDVLCRAVNAALFLSHGIRQDSHITLHLQGGDGPPRRIWFEGSKVRGLHPDERAIAGKISTILQLPPPAAGMMQEVTTGIWHDAGDLSTTIEEWRKEEVKLIILDAKANPLSMHPNLFDQFEQNIRLGFFLSDDLVFTTDEKNLLDEHASRYSISNNWLQGHLAIGITHHILDTIEESSE